MFFDNNVHPCIRHKTHKKQILQKLFHEKDKSEEAIKECECLNKWPPIGS
jgi:hypothetical protein